MHSSFSDPDFLEGFRQPNIWPNICRKLHEYGLGFPLDLEKLGRMRVHLENLEISWNFENFKRNHGKVK